MKYKVQKKVLVWKWMYIVFTVFVIRFNEFSKWKFDLLCLRGIMERKTN